MQVDRACGGNTHSRHAKYIWRPALATRFRDWTLSLRRCVDKHAHAAGSGIAAAASVALIILHLCRTLPEGYVQSTKGDKACACSRSGPAAAASAAAISCLLSHSTFNRAWHAQDCQQGASRGRPFQGLKGILCLHTRKRWRSSCRGAARSFALFVQASLALTRKQAAHSRQLYFAC